MITTIVNIKKVVLGLFVAVLFFVSSAATAGATTYYYPTSTSSYDAQIAALWQQVYALIAQLEAMGGVTTTPTPTYTNGNYDVEVSTKDVDVDGDEEATFEGEVELDGAPYAYVWFEYGEGGFINEKTDRMKVTTDKTFTADVDDLDGDDRYYFRAVAEDPAGSRTYGQLDGFETDGTNDDDDDDNDDDDNDDEDIPEVHTDDVDDISDDEASIQGEVLMNDFEDGLAFFVYGEDEESVEDVTNEDTYSDIDEDGDALQKEQAYSNLDDDRTFMMTIFGLDDDTEYFYRMCVEYEDEDGDVTLECGSVENFETDN